MKTRCLAYFISIYETSDIADEIRQTRDLHDLFRIMSNHKPYWNWMNIQVIKIMANDSEEAKKLIDQYKIDIFSKKVKDVLSEIPELEVPKDKYTEIIEKLNKRFYNLRIEEVFERWREIEKWLEVDETMLLKNIQGGCVEICWLLPKSLVERAVTSVKSKDKSLANYQKFFYRVLFFKIGDFTIMDNITSKMLIKL